MFYIYARYEVLQIIKIDYARFAFDRTFCATSIRRWIINFLRSRIFRFSRTPAKAKAALPKVQWILTRGHGHLRRVPKQFRVTETAPSRWSLSLSILRVLNLRSTLSWCRKKKKKKENTVLTMRDIIVHRNIKCPLCTIIWFFDSDNCSSSCRGIFFNPQSLQVPRS